MDQDRQGESPQQPGSPSNQWSGPGGPEKEPPRITSAPADPEGPFKAVGDGKFWSVRANGKCVYIVAGGDARDMAEAFALAMNQAWKLLEVPVLLKALRGIAEMGPEGRPRGVTVGDDAALRAWNAGFDTSAWQRARVALAALGKAGAL